MAAGKGSRGDHHDVLRVAAAVLLAVLCYKVSTRTPGAKLPGHLLGHEVYFQERLIAEDRAAKLRELIKDIGEYPTNVRDTNFYHTEHEHIGEAQAIEIEKDASSPSSKGRAVCAHPFLTPNKDGTLCVLPGRIDIGRHLIMSGGALGLREPYENIISRVQSFGAYHFDLDKYPQVSALFQDRKFVAAARRVCPHDQQHLDPFQFNFILQLPGQIVPIHIDGVYFWGASRFQFPQWLLAAMKFSGLWDDRFVHQVQVVAYLHRWQPKPTKRLDEDQSGSFVYWTNASRAEPDRVLPLPLAGSVVDGSKVVHSATVYRMDDADLPFMDKSKGHYLRVVPGTDGEKWVLMGDDDAVLRNYTFDDLRISMVYRGRCFPNSSAAEAFRSQLHGPDGEGGRLRLDDILHTFVRDLIRRGKLPSGSHLNSLPRLDLALKILDTYIKYPMPHMRTIPWNYCALPRVFPGWTSLQTLLSPFCGAPFSKYKK